MAIIGVNVTDRRGNVLPNMLVIARLVGAPAGDQGSNTTDALGNYRVVVTNAATEYDLYVESEEGSTSGPNWCGSRMSSGSGTTAYVLLNDSDFGIEHYITATADGSHPAGTHEQINVDNITMRTTGYFKFKDAYGEFRLSDDDNSKFRIYENNSVYWFYPRPVAGSNDRDIGLLEDYNAQTSKFFLGSAKTYYFNSDGDFNLSSGTFDSTVIFSTTGATYFNGPSTFHRLTGYPKLDSYADPPTDLSFITKKYFDDNAPGGGGVGAANYTQEMHKVVPADVTAGYFLLSQPAASGGSVAATIHGGVRQANKQVIIPGSTPDFDILSTNQVHINNTIATGLSEEIIADDVLIIDYFYATSS